VQLATAIGKSKSPDYSAQAVIPILAPILVAHSLPPQLFQDYLSATREALTRIEQWRLHSKGGAATDGASLGGTGAASWDDAPAASTSGAQTQSANGAVPALGLAAPDAGGSDPWAAVLGSPAQSAQSAGPSGSSSPVSLRSQGGGGAQAAPVSQAAAFQTARANIPRAMGRQGGSSSSLRNQMRGLNTGASNTGSASAASGMGLSASNGAAAPDPLAGLSAGGATAGSNGVARSPMPLPPPPSASASKGATGSGDPFADLLMSQPAPALTKRHASAGTGGLLGSAKQAVNGAAAQGKAGQGGGKWDDWDPFS
jgi:hypothetical protein